MAVRVVCVTAACVDHETDPLLVSLVRTAELASALGVTFFVFNSSSLPGVSARLAACHAVVYDAPPQGKEEAASGNAMRNALRAAGSLLGTEDGVLAWMEPDKHDFVRFVPNLAQEIIERKADVVAPSRPPDCHASGYPPEQAHAEAFGALYLNTFLAAHSASISENSGGRTGASSVRIDWFFGPIVLRASVAGHWLSSTHKQSTLALLLPLLAAVRAGAQLSTTQIGYLHTARYEPTLLEGGAPAPVPILPPTVESVQRQWLRLSSTVTLVAESIRQMATATATELATASAAATAATAAAAPGQAEATGAYAQYQLQALLPHMASGLV